MPASASSRRRGTEANIADCEERRGNVATAWEMNRTALGHYGREDARRNLLQKRIEKLEPRLPRLVLSLAADADKAAVVRDGETTLGTAGSYGTPLPIDPGVHHLVVSAPSCAPWTLDVKLVEGKTETVAVGACPSTSSSGSVGPWVVGGVGLLALLAGAVTGGLTVAKKSAVSAAHCTDGPPPRCPTQAGIDAAAAGRTLGVVTTASLVAGAAAVGAGAIWLGVQRGKRPVAQVGAGPLPGGAALQVGGHLVTAQHVARRARWMSGALALTVAGAACAISFPDYTLGAGGSASTSASTASASTASASTASASTASASTASASSTSTTTSGGTCDGGAGSWTKTLPFAARAFDVAADGSVVAVTVNVDVDAGTTGTVQAVCLNPDGTTARGQFTVQGSSFDASTFTVSDVDVARAATGEIAVSWSYHDSNQNADNKVAFLAADCSDLAAGADLEASAFNVKRLAVVRAAGSHFFFLYDAHAIGEIRLVRYSLNGGFFGGVTVGAGCNSGGYGRALGVGAAAGAVVGCQDTKGKRYYQRFSSNLIPLDTVPQAVPELDVVAVASATNVNGYLIEGNGSGAFAFVADPGSAGAAWSAVFVDGVSAKTVATITGGAALSNDRILSAPSGAFLLPVQAGANNFEELASSGIEGSWALDGAIFRVDGCNALYAMAGVTLSKSATPW